MRFDLHQRAVSLIHIVKSLLIWSHRSKQLQNFVFHAAYITTKSKIDLNQIKSFLLVYGAVKITINDQEVVWV